MKGMMKVKLVIALLVDYTKKTVNGLLIALAASVLLQVVLLLVVFVMGKLFSLNEVERQR
jgi:malate permease and related proteins